MRYISSGSMLVDDLLTLLEVTLVLAVSTLTYRFIELKGIETGRRLARSESRQLSQA